MPVRSCLPRSMAIVSILGSMGFPTAAAEISWGGTLTLLPSHLSTVTVPDAIGGIRFDNELSVNASDTYVWRFEIDGVKGAAVVRFGDSNKPDTMTLELPPGYVSVPESITMGEHESGVIAIYAAPGV